MNRSPVEQHMGQALALARRGLYTTTPNPRVGCVLLGSDGELLAEGFHERAGGPHAEAMALGRAGAAARGATVCVTLEPCAHQGRTGACCDALIAAGVARVIYGMQDPNPLVGGQGLARLRAAGIEVIGPVLEDDCLALNPGFIKRMTVGLPWVRCKMAMSLDGRTAMANGESQWITGPEARTDVQHWRAQSCAVVTGIGTALHDDPQLNVRDSRLAERQRQPLRVLLDTRGRAAPTLRLFENAASTVWVTGENSVVAPEEVEHWCLPADDGHIDLSGLLRRLADRGCNEVLLESGPTLAGAFLRGGLIDELIVYMAPKLMGSLARPLFDWPLHTMQECMSLDIRSVTPIGPDFRIMARPGTDHVR